MEFALTFSEVLNLPVPYSSRCSAPPKAGDYKKHQIIVLDSPGAGAHLSFAPAVQAGGSDFGLQ